MGSTIPKISVIIPTFNRLWSLPDAIASCRDEATRTEIIVVDDGSTDGTWEWLARQRDIIAIKTDNKGKCSAVNTALAVATGEYVRFLDSDDWLAPRANARQLAVALDTRADLVMARDKYFDEMSGEFIVGQANLSGDYLADYVTQVWSGRHTSYCACLFHRELISNLPHRPEYPWHDVMLMMEVLLEEPRVAFCDFEALVVRNHQCDRRLSFPNGYEEVVEAQGNAAMYKRLLELLASRRSSNPDRKKAVLGGLWIEARRIARWEPTLASELVEWVRSQDASFQPPVRPLVSRAYSLLGFAMTERLASAARRLRESRLWNN